MVKDMLNQGKSLDRVLHALAEPHRRSMVERLVRGPAAVSELAAPLPMSLPAVVQHLQVLEASGLVRSEKVGRVRTCHLEPAGLRMAEGWLHKQRTAGEAMLDRLGDFLADSADSADSADPADSGDSGDSAGPTTPSDPPPPSGSTS